MFYTMQRSGNSAPRARRRFPDFQILLQPVIDLQRQAVYAYEALCRGSRGQNYTSLVADLNPAHISAFDKLTLTKALRLAATLRLEQRGAKIAINLGSGLNLAGRDATYVLRLAKHYGIEPSSVVLELSQRVRMDSIMLARIVEKHRSARVLIAIDDLGAGYAGLNALVACRPDVVKIDRALIGNIESNLAKKTVVGSLAKMCRKLGIRLVAEGVETNAEFKSLRDLNVDLMQGFLFGASAVCELPVIQLPQPAERNFPRVTRHDRTWLRNALRQ